MPCLQETLGRDTCLGVMQSFVSAGLCVGLVVPSPSYGMNFRTIDSSMDSPKSFQDLDSQKCGCILSEVFCACPSPRQSALSDLDLGESRSLPSDMVATGHWYLRSPCLNRDVLCI